MNSYDWRISDFQTCEMSHRVNPRREDGTEAFGTLTLLTRSEFSPASELKMFFDDVGPLERLIDELMKLRTALLLEMATQDIRYPQPKPIEVNQ